MKITNKAKEDFLKWYACREGNTLTKNDLFYYSEKLIQNALVVEWFDSVGIYIEINVNQILDKKSSLPKCYFDTAIFHTEHRTKEGRTLTQLNINVSRKEATEQAIIKANEIYNSL